MKNTFLNFLLSIMIVVLVPQVSFADDKEKKKKPWSGRIEASYTEKKGNTDDIDFSVGSKLVYAGTVWKHSLSGSYSSYEFSDERLSEETELSYDIAFFFKPKHYIFNHLSYEKNIAEDIDKRLIEAIGYGHIFIKEKTQNLTAELGIGKRDTTYISDKADELETVGYLGVWYDKNLTKKISFEQEVIIVGSSDNPVSKSTTGLNLSLTKRLSLGLKYKISHTENPSDDIEKTDSTIRLALRFSF